MSYSHKRILLIEEDATLREITAFRLELLGHTVDSFSTGEQAITQLLQELPDAVIIGHFLPDMDGLELVDRLSNEVRTSEVPVMLLSPNAELEDVQRAFNSGADEFLVTPFDPQTLEQKLTRLLSDPAAASV
ncbi:response regulator [Botrimarina hoheduenensis]|uniref:Phosphate regulon transcriptional regulatory protein PhoB n=1 Tax=Botrimarina hoheduenensis TaxID=2528000 RepID=A0A5C5WEG2_9BACT|nr:response regulator [Botrimarina hoheduenensis]TWT48877.1 Phosphate regulon transcriptional regulatory protein PhoB [Botrimarina hoheduenensis]